MKTLSGAKHFSVFLPPLKKIKIKKKEAKQQVAAFSGYTQRHMTPVSVEETDVVLAWFKCSRLFGGEGVS